MTDSDMPARDTAAQNSARPATAPPRGRLRALRLRRSHVPLIGVYLWAQVVLVLWWAAAFPGLLSYDSTVYVTHVTIGPWTADHSVLYDFFTKVSLHLCHNIYLLTLGQTVVWSLILAYVVSTVHRWGVRWRWAVIPAIVLPLVPSFGAFVSSLWKDVPFAMCVVLLTATLLRIAEDHRPGPSRRRLRKAGRDSERQVVAGGALRTRRRLLIVLTLELIGLVLFRNDGFVMVAALTVILVIVVRGLRWRMLLAGLTAIAAMLVAQQVIYPAAHIRRPNSSLSYGTFFPDIAVIYRRHPHIFTASDKALMRKVAPLPQWRAGGNCYNSDDLRYRPGYNRSAADKYRKQLTSLWFRTLARAPVGMIRSRLCRAAIAWNPVDGPVDRAPLVTMYSSVSPELFGRAKLVPKYARKDLPTHPLVKSLGTLAVSLHVPTVSHNHLWDTLIWRGATWCYLAYLALALAAWRSRRKMVWLAGLGCLGNQLMVMAANPAQSYRYMAAPIFAGMLLLPLALAARRSPPADDSTSVPLVAAPSEDDRTTQSSESGERADVDAGGATRVEP